MMTIGKRLGGYLEQRALKQTAVAADWLERWTHREEKGPTWVDATINSNLSRLLNDQVQGIRFFFQDMVRGKLLLQALQVPESEWTEVFTLAGSALRREGASAKVIIDVTGFGPVGVTHASDVFTELKRLLVLEGPYPIDLVLLEEQYDRLPRSLDPLLSRERDRVRTVQVKTPEQGWQVTLERAEDLGLVISARRYPVFERWIAADFDGTTLQLEPIRGMDWLRQKGALPSLPSVTHDLARLVPAGAEKRVGPHQYSACAQHRWLHVLSSEEASAQSGADAATRQGLARFLGITASSTPKERLDAEIQALQRELPAPLKLQTASAEDLRTHHQRARRRKLEPTAIRVADTVYLLNVPDADRLARSRPWVSVHELKPDPSELGLLLAEVDRWSEFDFLRDPFLEHLIHRLDPEEKKRTAFLHARAGLLLNDALRVQTPVPEAQWQPLLEELLAGDPPAAQLRIHMHGTLMDQHGNHRTPFVVTRSRAERLEQTPSTPLQHVPPFGDALLQRTDSPLIVLGNASSRTLFDTNSEPTVLIANTAARARNPEFWLDDHELSSSPRPKKHNPPEFSYYRHRYEHSSHYPQHLPHPQPWQTQPLFVAPESWDLTDRELALSWLALRMALVNPRAVRLPGGAVLLQLGGSFFAELRIFRLAQPAVSAPVQACLLVDTDAQKLGWDRDAAGYVMTDKAFHISDLVATHTVTGGYDFGARLPKRIHILGERVSADIRFRGSALFSEASPSPLHPAAVARIDREKQQAAREREAAEARAVEEASTDDDDYDDSDDD